MSSLRTIERPYCPVCGGTGRVRYEDLEDRLFGAPGRWRMRECKLAGCASLWLDPAPHPDDLWIAYREYYTHAADAIDGPPSTRHLGRQVWAAWLLGYPMPSGWSAKASAVGMLARPRKIERVSFQHLHLPFVNAGRLLDVGCGAGNQLRLMRAFGWQVSGVDPDPQAVATAQASALDVRAGDLLSVRWPDAHFDAITLVHVIEHLVEPQRHLAECARILKPAGRLLVITPNVRSLAHRGFLRDRRGLEPPRHLQLYAAAGLRQALANAGLDVKRIKTSARDAAYMLWFSAQLRAARRVAQPRVTLRSKGPALRLWRELEGVERVAAALSIPVGEEIVCLAGVAPACA